MKREKLLRHLRQHGCSMVRGGSRHSWRHIPARNRRSAIPRHREIHGHLAPEICADLGVPPVEGS